MKRTPRIRYAGVDDGGRPYYRRREGRKLVKIVAARKTCAQCGNGFWTFDADQDELCVQCLFAGNDLPD